MVLCTCICLKSVLSIETTEFNLWLFLLKATTEKGESKEGEKGASEKKPEKGRGLIGTKGSKGGSDAAKKKKEAEEKENMKRKNRRFSNRFLIIRRLQFELKY